MLGSYVVKCGDKVAAAMVEFQDDPVFYYGSRFALTATEVSAVTASDNLPMSEYVAGQAQQNMRTCIIHRQCTLETHALWESALRSVALLATPTMKDQRMRLKLMQRLKGLAATGINFCHGLTLEPYGSFASGLYTPHGDLDFSIEGTAAWSEEEESVGGKASRQIDVKDMDRKMRVKFLRAFSNRIRHGIARDILALLHERVRVPIIKFVTIAEGVECDISCDGSKALFKSTLMGLLAHYEWRFGALVRLVKTWARRNDLNDPANGTFNSYCLSLMVVFFLQTRAPRILPPFKELFTDIATDHSSRLMEDDHPVTEDCWLRLQAASAKLEEMALAREEIPSKDLNHETLFELFSGFFALYAGMLKNCSIVTEQTGADGEWTEALARTLRHTRINTWDGAITTKMWDGDKYCSIPVEDPFDTTDNCARTVRYHKAQMITQTFAKADFDLNARAVDATSVLDQLKELFGSDVAVDSSQTGWLSGTKVIPPIRPVDLILPPHIQDILQLPITHAPVDHCHSRGSGTEEELNEAMKAWQVRKEDVLIAMEGDISKEIVFIQSDLESRKQVRHKVRAGKRVAKAGRVVAKAETDFAAMTTIDCEVMETRAVFESIEISSTKPMNKERAAFLERQKRRDEKKKSALNKEPIQDRVRSVEEAAGPWPVS